MSGRAAQLCAAAVEMQNEASLRRFGCATPQRHIAGGIGINDRGLRQVMTRDILFHLFGDGLANQLTCFVLGRAAHRRAAVADAA